nr:immunoglobulin heavy chain junction region [Macaca mulatta]MOW83292.1 immunoglobulin heavy chain junction region [Macaca mulatta]
CARDALRSSGTYYYGVWFDVW